MVSYWVNTFELALVDGRRPVQAVARPFTQPVGLEVRFVGRRGA